MAMNDLARMQGLDPVINGAGFADQLRIQLSLTGDPEDRILVEIASEVDRLESLMSLGKPSIRADLAVKRIAALGKLHSIIQERKENRTKESELAIVGMIMKNLKICLKELEISPEIIETLVENLISKIADETSKKSRVAK